MRSLTAKDYVPIFKNLNVTLVIRLNTPCYDSSVFTQNGINHADLYFPDGAVPNPDVISQFMRLVENNTGAIAVHCKAGLGRTSTLIALYLMKHYRFCASDAIAWLRIVRPGSVLGPQQQFLVSIQSHVFESGIESLIWRNLKDSYKNFVAMMHETQDKIDVEVSEEELMIAMQGDHNQGTLLLRKKLAE